MKVRLKLFFNWGISFEEDNPYTVEENANREVKYAEQKDLHDAVMRVYHPEMLAPEETAESTTGGMTGNQDHTHSQTNEPQGNPLKGRVADARKTTQTRSTPPGVKPSNTSEVKPNEST